MKNPNSDNSDIGHKLPDNEEIGHMLPKTVGADSNLFEQTLPSSEAIETDGQGQTAQLQSALAHRLGINTGGEDGILPSSPDGDMETSVQDTQSAIARNLG